MAFLIAHVLYVNEEERLEAYNAYRVYRRFLRDSNNPFELDEFNFKKLFRLPKDTIQNLIETLRPTLKKKRSTGLAVEIQVLTAIRFMAFGSYQRDIGQDCLIPISQPSVSRCLKSVSMAIYSELMATWIKFPRTIMERNAISTEFQIHTGYPGVLGCIDCTHIAIVTPNVREEAYVNHKGFHSLNVQMVCDSNLQITNVYADFPGSVHDQFIFNNSNVSREMNRLSSDRVGQYFLLGDSGYTCESYMLTPVLHAVRDSPEFGYTKNHCLVRNKIERVFGVLKARWRCLHSNRVLHYSPRSSAIIVYACAILHNISMQRFQNEYLNCNDEYVEIDPPVEGLTEHQHNVDRAAGRRLRQTIIDRYFT